MTGEKVDSLKWKVDTDDVKPFLESPDDLVTITKENLLVVLLNIP